tara:strand:+ start:160 stop:702 length:543 start_codon:yes stop_codon:yes gene_type:complete
MKQYNLKGIGSTVELGKQGAKIVASSASVVEITDSNGAAEVVFIAAGSTADNAVTKTQMESELGYRVQTVNETVTYSGGSQYLFTAKADTTILSTMIEQTAGNWTGYNDTTNITVGDGSSNGRLHGIGFTPDNMQYLDETTFKYTTETDIYAYVTQGGASAGGARIRITHTGPELDQTGP